MGYFHCFYMHWVAPSEDKSDIKGSSADCKVIKNKGVWIEGELTKEGDDIETKRKALVRPSTVSQNEDFLDLKIFLQKQYQQLLVMIIWVVWQKNINNSP